MPNLNSLKIKTLCTLIVAAAKLASQPCITGVINQYAEITGFGCDTSTLVFNGANFADGDLVLLIQMRGAILDTSNTAAFGTVLELGTAGNFELLRVKSSTSNVVFLDTKPTKKYDLNGAVQLIRVPEYQNAKVCDLKAIPFNGTTGGIIALSVQETLTLEGDIDASGAGFAGGFMANDDNYFPEQVTDFFTEPTASHVPGMKGQGVMPLSFRLSFGRGNAANGGGGGNKINSGGGGGAGGGAGGRGGFNYGYPYTNAIENSGLPGQPVGLNFPDRAFLGGGGGGGHANNWVAANGGFGGGIVLVCTKTLQSNGFAIRADGADAVRPGPIIDTDDGQGAGGGGGTVLLDYQQITGIGATIFAKGGKGADTGTGGFSGYPHGPGGGGGGGTVRVSVPNPKLAVIVSGGETGVAIQTNDQHFAEKGQNGTVETGFACPVSTNSPPTFSLQTADPTCHDLTDGIALVSPAGQNCSLDGGAFQPSNFFPGLAAGPHKIVVQYAGGCEFEINFELKNPPALLDSLLFSSPENCLDKGFAALEASGGTGQILFKIDIGNWQPNGFFADLDAGQHTVFIKDSAGCEISRTISIGLDNQTVTTVLNPSICRGDTLFLPGGIIMTESGTQIQTFINMGGCDSTVTVNLKVFDPPPPTEISSTVCFGDSVLVFGNAVKTSGVFQQNFQTLNGCDSAVVWRVEVLPEAKIQIADPTCNGFSDGIAAASPAGQLYSLDGGVFQPNPIFENLAAGPHQIRVQLSPDCQTTFNFELKNPPPLTLNLNFSSPENCLGKGWASFEIGGGTGQISCKVDGGNWQPTGIFQGLSGGSHQFFLRDSVGCEIVQNFEIGIDIQADTTVSERSVCRGDTLFLANGIAMTEDGSQVQLLKNSGGCDSLNTVILEVLELPDTAKIHSTICFGDSVLVFGKAVKTPGIFEQNFSSENGCDSVVLWQVSVLPELKIAVETSPACPNRFDGSAKLEISGGLPPYFLNWPGGPDTLAENLPPGNFQLILIDAFGCSKTETFAIEQAETCPYNFYAPNVFYPKNTSGLNDWFCIFTDVGVSEIRFLQVFDRWGELIFERQNFAPNDPRLGWDGSFRGKIMDSAVFVWVAELVLADDGRTVLAKGNVSLVR